MYPSRVINTVVSAAARHGQQQHRAVYGLHRRPLLRVQRRHMGGCKFRFIHGGSFRQIVNNFRMAACIVGGGVLDALWRCPALHGC